MQRPGKDNHIVITNNKKIVNMVIATIGIVSGFAYALLTMTFNFWISDINVDITKITIIFATVQIIIAVRLLYMPIFEKYNMPILSKFMDRTNAWIFTLIALVGVLIFCAGHLNPKTDLKLLIIFLACASILWSALDTLVRGKIIHISKDTKERTTLSGLGAFGFRIGMALALQGLIILSFKISWGSIYKISGILIALLSILVTLIPKSEVNTNSKSLSELLILPSLSFINKHKHHIWAILGFVLFFRLQDRLLAPVMNKFFLSLKPTASQYFLNGLSIIPGFSKITLTAKGVLAASKTSAFFLSMFGLLGSIAVLRKYSYKYNATVAALLHASTCIPLLMLNNTASHPVYLILITIIIEKVLRGFSSQVYYLYQSQFCEKEHAVGQIAALGLIESGFGAIFAIASGFIIKVLSWNHLFILASLISLPVLIFIRKLPDYK